MKPVNTIYRLSKPKDVAACKKIWADWGPEFVGEPTKLGWPTIVAERNGKILGFLSTRSTRRFIEIGPMVIAKGCHAITVLRLIEAYEVVLRMAKVTNYWFHVEKSNTKYLNLIAKFGIKPREETEDGIWFERVI